jgi:hypothetical protein
MMVYYLKILVATSHCEAFKYTMSVLQIPSIKVPILQEPNEFIDKNSSYSQKINRIGKA